MKNRDWDFILFVVFIVCALVGVIAFAVASDTSETVNYGNCKITEKHNHHLFSQTTTTTEKWCKS